MKPRAAEPRSRASRRPPGGRTGSSRPPRRPSRAAARPGSCRRTPPATSRRTRGERQPARRRRRVARSARPRRRSVSTRGVPGPQHRHRVRVEGHRHDWHAALTASPGPGDHVLVAPVDAVEDADHHDGAPQVGRAPHRWPARAARCGSTNAAGSDEDGYGPARAVARLGEREELPSGPKTADGPARPTSSAADRTSASLLLVEVDGREGRAGGRRQRQHREVARRARRG